MWQQINLRGCFPIIDQIYATRLIKGNAFLAIELGGAVTVLLEITALALALSFVCQITREVKRNTYHGVATN